MLTCKIINLYINHNYKIIDISKKYNLSHTAIYKTVNEHMGEMCMTSKTDKPESDKQVVKSDKQVVKSDDKTDKSEYVKFDDDDNEYGCSNEYDKTSDESDKSKSDKTSDESDKSKSDKTKSDESDKTKSDESDVDVETNISVHDEIDVENVDKGDDSDIPSYTHKLYEPENFYGGKIIYD